MAGISPTNRGYSKSCNNPDCQRLAVKKGSEGPPRLYCSNACRTAAWRKRQASEPPTPPATPPAARPPTPSPKPHSTEPADNNARQRIAEALAALNDPAVLQAAQQDMTNSAAAALQRARQALTDGL